jgi:hypothetical protein
MAITNVEYAFLSLLAQRNIFTKQSHVLELGEQHWHGDIPIEYLKHDLNTQIQNEAEKQELLKALENILERKDKKKIFDITKIAYKVFFNYSNICAIDLHGTEDALQFDLNHPVHIDRTFDIIINLGTAEHIFNVYQFFKTVHELTSPGGLMLHCMPFLGWVDHGFFNFQPTFYWDLAEANGYQVVAFLFQANEMGLVEVGDRNGVLRYMHDLMTNQGKQIVHSNIYVAFQKNTDSQDFKIPRQGFFQMSTEEYWNLTEDNFVSIADKLKLKQINLVAFPDWNQSEELIMTELEEVVKSLAKHPDRQRMALLMDISNFPSSAEITPELFLSTLAINILLNDKLDIPNDGPEITLIDELTDKDWQTLLPQINYRVPLSAENIAAVEKRGLGKVKLYELSKLT